MNKFRKSISEQEENDSIAPEGLQRLISIYSMLITIDQRLKRKGKKQEKLELTEKQ